MIRRRPTCAPLAALAAALLVCGAGRAEADVAPATAPDAERLAKALTLAQTVQPREMVVDQSMATLDEQMVAGLMADPNLKTMESENPGIIAAMWKGARPIIAETLAKSLPDLWNGLAGVYARHLTSAQLDETIRLFRSPTGRKFVLAMNRNTDIKPMIRDAARQGDGQIGEKSYMQTVSRTATATAATMSPAEIAEFDRFLATPAGQAFLGVGSDVTKVILEWTNRKDPAAEARVEAAMIAAGRKFLEPGRASK